MGCKRNFKKNQKNFFSSSHLEKPGKAEVPALLLSMREHDAPSDLVAREAIVEGFLQETRFLREKGNRDPSFRFLTFRMSNLRELPKFYNRFRLPKDPLGAHHRTTVRKSVRMRLNWRKRKAETGLRRLSGLP
jgi:hypothetical protein